jgi:sodium-independent sulfate anion transporter 11
LAKGVTVAAVIVPQAMAYASLARLPPAFGLYSSFVGGLTYWIFATSKDISMGPIAVMSLVVGNVVAQVGEMDPDIAPYVVASLLSLSAGAVLLLIGLLRLGWIIDFVSHTVIMAFMTSSALTAASTQFTVLLGIKGAHTRGAAVWNVISILTHVKGMQGKDAAMGVTALIMLYSIRTLGKCMHARKPNQKAWFFALTLRTIFVISLYTIVSYIINRNRMQTPAFKIVGAVPKGLRDIRIPVLNVKVLRYIAPSLPISCIVMVMEHISIAKSFARESGHQVNASQEMAGIGVANVVGSFFGAFPATGSFSRTAINNKSGVKTPLGGAITATLVILAIYVLPGVFFFIPSAPLAAIILHAVLDLLPSISEIKQLWKVSPVELPLYCAAVITAIFYSMDVGTYLTIGLSILLLLYKSARAHGSFLESTKIYSSIDSKRLRSPFFDSSSTADGDIIRLAYGLPRNLFLPKGAANSKVIFIQPYPGVIIFRFSTLLSFHNASNYMEELTNYVHENTRRMTPYSENPKDRVWSILPLRPTNNSLPTLKAIIFDFSAVDVIDMTSALALKDAKEAFSTYAAPAQVQYHFANVLNRWTRRSLASFGFGSNQNDQTKHVHSIIYLQSLLNLQGSNSQPIRHVKSKTSVEHVKEIADPDEVSSVSSEGSISSNPRRNIMLTSVNRPFFHPDVEGAVASVLQNLESEKSIIEENSEDEPKESLKDV